MKAQKTAILAIILISLMILMSGCLQNSKIKNGGTENNQINQPDSTSAPENTTLESTPVPSPSPTPEPQVEQIDLQEVKPNEAGKIMVVMFHNFVESYKSGDKLYTTTFDEFRKLLPELYAKGYRPIGLNDLLSSNINVPAGCIPIVFTFDDGTAGQFNLVEGNGTLTVNSQSAVGIMEEFNKTHPDFAVKGTFFVNLGNSTFSGKGTLAERLRYLIDKGFEIGNHTYTHTNLKKVKTAEEIQKVIGENQKKMYELIPGYTFTALSLPYGLPSKELQHYVAAGEFEGVKYDNKAIMEVGWDPTTPAISRKFNPLSIHRVRSSGIEPVDADLAWWIGKLSREEQYVSDGDPGKVTVPKAREESVDTAKLSGRSLMVY